MSVIAEATETIEDTDKASVMLKMEIDIRRQQRELDMLKQRFNELSKAMNWPVGFEV